MKDTIDDTFTPLDHKKPMLSLCPVLGKTHAQFERMKCSKDLQRPEGKNLSISYLVLGDDVYIKYSKPFGHGGCDIIIMDIMAHKFKFSYELMHPTTKHFFLVEKEVT